MWIEVDDIVPSDLPIAGDMDGDAIGEVLWQDVGSGRRSLRELDGNASELMSIPVG